MRKKSSKNSQVLAASQLMSGIETHYKKSESLPLQSKTVSVASILAMLPSRIDAARSAEAARATWRAAVQKEHDLRAQTDALLAAVVQYVSVVHGPSVDALADFGLAPRKPPRALSGAEIAQKAAKAKATRAARHTLGDRQRAKIKGGATPPPAIVATPPTPAAPPAVVVNGGNGGNGAPPNGVTNGGA